MLSQPIFKEQKNSLDIPKLRRQLTIDARRITKEGIIELSDERYDFDNATNRDLLFDEREKPKQGVEYFNITVNFHELFELLSDKHIKTQTEIKEPDELGKLSRACGKIFFQLLQNKNLIKGEDCQKIMTQLLQHDTAFLERVATFLKKPYLKNQNLDFVLSTAFERVAAFLKKPYLKNQNLDFVLSTAFEKVSSSTHRNRLFTINTKIDTQQTNLLDTPSPKSR